MKKIYTLFLSFLLTGCASEKGYWYKDGITQEAFAKINYTCLQQSQQPAIIEYRVNNSILDRFLADKETSMITNETLYSACMNSYGLYWKVDIIH